MVQSAIESNWLKMLLKVTWFEVLLKVNGLKCY